jgi:hypothetical protein
MAKLSHEFTISELPGATLRHHLVAGIYFSQIIHFFHYSAAFQLFREFTFSKLPTATAGLSGIYFS